MTKHTSSQVPQVPAKSLEEAAAAAMDSAKEKVTQFPAPAQSDDIVYNSYDNKVLKGNQNQPGGWLHGPANLELFSAAADFLQELNTLRGSPTEKVEWVRAALFRSSKKVHIHPTDREDPDAIPVVFYRSGAWINLITLLGNTRLKVETGFRQRYSIRQVPKGPVGPALELNLSRMLERRAETRKYRSIGAPNAEAPSAVPSDE